MSAMPARRFVPRLCLFPSLWFLFYLGLSLSLILTLFLSLFSRSLSLFHFLSLFINVHLYLYLYAQVVCDHLPHPFFKLLFSYLPRFPSSIRATQPQVTSQALKTLRALLSLGPVPSTTLGPVLLTFSRRCADETMRVETVELASMVVAKPNTIPRVIKHLCDFLDKPIAVRVKGVGEWASYWRAMKGRN